MKRQNNLLSIALGLVATAASLSFIKSANAVSRQSVNKDYVQLALSIALSSGELTLPNQAFARGGVSCEELFINNLFSEWNPSTPLSSEFRAILIEFADSFLKKRWPQVATFFEPNYYNEQLSFLGSGRLEREGIVKIMRQFIHEALIGKFDGSSYTIYSIDPDRIRNIKFLDIVDDPFNDESAVIRFRLIQDDGTTLDTGYRFYKDTYFFEGGRG